MTSLNYCDGMVSDDGRSEVPFENLVGRVARVCPVFVGFALPPFESAEWSVVAHDEHLQHPAIVREQSFQFRPGEPSCRVPGRVRGVVLELKPDALAPKPRIATTPGVVPTVCNVPSPG